MLLIAGEKVLYAFYHEGYIRLSCLQYDIASGDITVHLTNQYVQKKHPTYNDIKEDTVIYIIWFIVLYHVHRFGILQNFKVI